MAIDTENIVYIGSANISNESKNNIESGIIIEDKEFIQKLYHEFFEDIRKFSLPYYDDDYMVLRLVFRRVCRKSNCLWSFDNGIYL